MTQWNGPGAPVPGWYPCPWDQRQLRWWDGQNWTGAVTGYPPAAALGYRAPDPSRDLADEQVAAARARWALVGFCAAQLVTLFVLASTLSQIVDQFRHQIAATNNNPDNPPPFHPHYPPLFWIGELTGLAALLFLLLFMLWANRAAELASRAGLPARLSPGWAVAGFFVPVVNLWFPYQSVVDTLPPGHPGRSLVGHWWAWYLLQGAGPIAVLLAGFAGRGPALIVAACCTPFPVLTMLTGRRVIDAVSGAHRELLGATAVAETAAR